MSLRIVFALLALAIPLCGQTWEDLRVLQDGDNVKVRDTAGKEFKGAFKSFSATAITLRTKKTELSIDRVRVRQVQIPSDSRRLRNFLIGTAVGVAIGATVDLTIGVYFRNELGEGPGARALTYVVPIGLCGGVGALAGYRTIYKYRGK